MKRVGWLRVLPAAAVLSLAACGGDGDGDGGDVDDETPMEEQPSSEDSFLRNPDHPLSCDRPITENPLTAPLVRLTDREYVNTLRDLFEGVVDAGKIPLEGDLPAEPVEGLFSNNVTIQRMSTTRADLYEGNALSLASEAVKNLPALMGCEPANAGEESACVSDFIKNFGLRAWRRPLGDDERAAAEALFAESRKEFDFPTSVQSVVAGLLGSPQFLYRVEEGAGQETDTKGRLLSGYEMASRLSFLIWDSMPDAQLFEAAEKGELSNADQVEKAALRMLQDDRARGAVARFYREWLHIERVESRLSPAKKATDPGDPYEGYGDPQYLGLMASLDRFLEDAFWDGDHSMSRLFTSSQGFVNDDTASIFGVDQPGSEDLQKVALPSEQRMGFLTQPAFMAGWAHETEQAPILRGAFVMEHILCAPPPNPPADVVIELKPVDNRDAITYRQFVANTVEQGSCKACHQIIDGYGFLFENYDGIGAYQTKERHLDIDASNDIVGTYDLDGHYENAIAFTKALSKSEQAAQCAVEKFYEYAMSRSTVGEDGCAIAPLTDSFIESGFDFHVMMAKLVRSTAFRFRTTMKD